MAESVIKQPWKAKTSETISGTTNSNGELALDSSVWTPSKRVILAVYDSAGFIYIPFCSESRWYIKALNSNMTIRSATAINVHLKYLEM